MNINFILKTLNEAINKCSNDSLKEKYSRLSTDELKEKLKGKLNPLEEKDYDNLVDNLECFSLFEKEDISPEMQEEIDEYTEGLFNYNKRIDRGYDLEKNKDKIPSYNMSDYVEDTFNGTYDYNLGKHEQVQIEYQEDNLDLTVDERSSLQSYFGNDYKHINGELDENYSDGYWSRLNKQEQEAYHRINKELIPNIDDAINKNDGLIVSTVLYHGTNDTCLIDIHTRIGDRIKTKGYVSTSYNRNVGEAYGSMPGGFVIQFLAPKGTKGLCANTGGLTEELGEHEYLLGRGQSGTVVDIDYNNHPPLCRILLD